MSADIKVNKIFTPMIYAYTTPNDVSHKGWTKIGYTASQTVENRIFQQTHTADVKTKILWKGNALYQDGSFQPFTDHDFHEFLVNKKHVKRKENTEWFNIDGDLSHKYFYQFSSRDYRNINVGIEYKLRSEQNIAVKKTMNYFLNNGYGNKYLWNAKPRFGKTLTTYDLVMKMQLRDVLVVTNRPSVANSWLEDFDKFISWKNDYLFVSDTEALKKSDALTSEEYMNKNANNNGLKRIAFESLQGLKGSIYFGGRYDKLKWIKDTHWDLLVIDESHEGVDTEKTDIVFNEIKRNNTLYLSGTPFKALANGEFESNQIYNWSYYDEQKAKYEWDEEKHGANPYSVIPKLNMFTYKMSDFMENKVKHGIVFNNDKHINPAFDLNEFFKVINKKFVYDKEIDKFLNALTANNKFPFSSENLRSQLSHTFWLLSRIDSAKLLAKKLKNHPVFNKYKIILAAGDGSYDNSLKETDDALKRVNNAINKYDKTITISVGQLTTGVTVKPWSGVMMLSNMKSPSEYMQAAFRAQNPYRFRDENGKWIQKENAYVFDFDPARTLTIFDEFSNNLSINKVNNDVDRKNNIRKLLNFFPVIGEDDGGEMVPLNPDKILSIPRKLKSQEVVSQGFISNFLFRNISNVFNAPSEIKDILSDLTPDKQNKKTHNTFNESDEINLDEDGNVSVDDKKIIGKYADLFTNKEYEYKSKKLRDDNNDFDLNLDSDDFIKSINSKIDSFVSDSIAKVTANDEKYDKNNSLSDSEIKRIHNKWKKENENKLDSIVNAFNNKNNFIKNEAKKRKKIANSDNEINEIQNDLLKKTNKLLKDFNDDIQNKVTELSYEIPKNAVRRIEKQKEENKKNDIESDIRSRLRGFSRTIPSFIMAYGNENLTLKNFDKYVESNVFKEVTGISKNQFRFLRDGGDYKDKETNKIKHFDGKIFDEIIFNDSIKGFLALKNKLSDYFNNDKEDIFDYIPPQQTNQIFTPKKVVIDMVDKLEKNNPNIFSDPNKTFIDLYMKSGLYITEIVKRLFKNKKMKELYPNDRDRIRHIMEKQVYGLAPTRIIYLISTNYIFGFNDDIKNDFLNQHFKNVDSSKYVSNNQLNELIRNIF